MEEETICKMSNSKQYIDLFFKEAGKPSSIWFQTTFTNKIGSISLIHLGFSELYDYKWEIYCLKGELFEDIERFQKLNDAIERIRELLKYGKEDGKI